jgi:hypothetical protein
MGNPANEIALLLFCVDGQPATPLLKGRRSRFFFRCDETYFFIYLFIATFESVLCCEARALQGGTLQHS